MSDNNPNYRLTVDIRRAHDFNEFTANRLVLGIDVNLLVHRDPRNMEANIYIKKGSGRENSQPLLADAVVSMLRPNELAIQDILGSQIIDNLRIQLTELAPLNKVGVTIAVRPEEFTLSTDDFEVYEFYVFDDKATRDLAMLVVDSDLIYAS